MPRAKKIRTVCGCLLGDGVERSVDNHSGVGLSIDELESLRLADLEGFEQSECARRMGVSRGTFQRVLWRARKKVAFGVLSGLGIRRDSVSSGGEILAGDCGGGGSVCCRYCGRRLSSDVQPSLSHHKIVLACDGGELASDLGRCGCLVTYELSGGKVTDTRRVDVSSLSGEEKLAVISGSGACVVFCGATAGEFRMELAGHGIKVVTGLYGSEESVLSDYMSGALVSPCACSVLGG